MIARKDSHRMHTLENVLRMFSADCKHRQLDRVADILVIIAEAAHHYVPPTAGQDPLEALNRELTDLFWRRQFERDAIAFMCCKRRASWSELEAWARDLADADEGYPGQLMRRVRLVICGLVRNGKLRRYGKGAFEYVPKRQRAPRS
jgi:hypothetical protein